VKIDNFFAGLKRRTVSKVATGGKKDCAAGIQVLLVVQFRIIKSHDHNHL
jgi:hypothetical protein